MVYAQLKKMLSMLKVEEHLKVYFLHVRSSGSQSITKHPQKGALLQPLMLNLTYLPFLPHSWMTSLVNMLL